MVSMQHNACHRSESAIWKSPLGVPFLGITARFVDPKLWLNEGLTISPTRTPIPYSGENLGIILFG